MNSDISKVCCFLGHRKIDETLELRNLLYETIESLIINHGVHTFLFGSKSQFDKLALETVTMLKEKYPHIKRIYVRAEYFYIRDSYRNYLLKSYDDTYFPQHIENAGKASYIERNYTMIDESHFCIVYYNQDFLPEKRKLNKRNLFPEQPKSGTKIAYEYAVKKDKTIFNTYNK